VPARHAHIVIAAQPVHGEHHNQRRHDDDAVAVQTLHRTAHEHAPTIAKASRVLVVDDSGGPLPRASTGTVIKQRHRQRKLAYRWVTNGDTGCSEFMNICIVCLCSLLLLTSMR